jgi:N6-L-threonylcarbamoyladenine synthase
MSLDVPLIEVNHLQAHILCHFIEDANPMPPKFPFLCLTVSGGHTMIVLVKIISTWKSSEKPLMMLLVKLLIKSENNGFRLSCGPIIDKLAKLGDENAFTFGKPN